MSTTASANVTTDVPIALHITSWVTLFSAVIAVNSVMADSSFVAGVMLVAGIGQCISIYMRKRGMSSRVLEFTVFSICVAGYLRTMMTSYDILSFHSGASDSPQIQFAALLAWMEAMRSLTLTSDEAVLFSGVPSIAIIGLTATDNINPDIIGYFILYLFCITAMLSQCSQLRLRRYAVPGTPRLGLQSQLRPAIIVTLLAVCIGGLLAWPLRYVTVKAVRHRIYQLAPSGGRMISLRPASDTVSATGGPVQASDIEILTVKASSPCYLRANVFDHYTGQVWERTDTEFRKPGLPRLAMPSGSTFEHIVRIRRGYSTELLTAAEPVYVEQVGTHVKDVGQMLVNSDRCWRSERMQVRGFRYKVVSALPEDSPTKLAQSSSNYPEEIVKKYLQKPAIRTDKPSRVRELAEKVSSSGANVYEKALAIETYLSRNYTYDLEAPAAPQGQDVVEYFLFKSRRGYCTAVASSMVMMLRELGIPARLAVGYGPGIYDSQEQVYSVREKDRHAWVEVYFTGYGWVTFDPSGSEEVRQPGFWAVVVRESRATFRRLITDRPWMMLVAILAVTLIYLVRPDLASRNIRLPRRRRGDCPYCCGVYRQYARMCGIVGRFGAVRLPSSTPSEYSSIARLQMAPGSDASLLVDRITRIFEDIRYGGKIASRTDLEEMKSLVKRLNIILRRERRW